MFQRLRPWIYLHVEKDSGSFSGHFSQPSWSCVLEVQLSLRHRLLTSNMTMGMSLDSFCYTNLHIIGRKTGDMVAVDMAALKVIWRHVDLN
jgi:hypothetical protein